MLRKLTCVSTLALAVGFFSAYSQAAESTKYETEIKELKERVKTLEQEVEKANEKIEMPSRRNREKLNYGFAWGPSVYHDSFGSAFVAKYFVNADNLISAEFFSGDDDESGYPYEETQRFGFGWQHFLGNSFYIKTSVFYNRTDRRDSHLYAFDRWVETSNNTFQGIGASFEIGNEWQWENFFIGVSWIGGSVMPIRINSDDPNALDEYQNSTGFNENDLFGLQAKIGIAF